MNRSRSISEQLAVCDAQQVKPQGAGPRSPRKVVAVIDEYSFTGRESGITKAGNAKHLVQCCIAQVL